MSDSRAPRHGLRLLRGGLAAPTPVAARVEATESHRAGDDLDDVPSAVHVSPVHRGDGALPVRSREERVRTAAVVHAWTPLIRRLAVRVADRCAHAVTVGDLSEAALEGLLRAIAETRDMSPDVDVDPYLEAALVAAMRRRLLDGAAAR